MFSQIFGEAQSEVELDEDGNPIAGAEEGLAENPELHEPPADPLK